MSGTRIGIVGAGGRMGRMLLEAALKDEGVTLAAAFDVPGSAAIGQTAGQLTGLASGIGVSDDLASGLAAIDCLIDFTRPQGTLAHLELCRQAGVGMVIGTTGFEDEGKERIAAAARDIPVVFAPNMAVGVNLVFKLLDTAARILNQGYDIEIVEAHHKRKIDAPSGTAKRLAEIAKESRGKASFVHGREGKATARAKDDIAILALRGGDVIGDHHIHFLGEGERIELVHRASTRDLFAAGALRAAGWLVGKPAGRYGLGDVLRS